ncbi:MAG: T9SS type A sorting domain-containing protein, partial [Cytophagales bacterium]|nr:T9SS type A sorting domain-containing protein [Cytophagales bacterium]
NLTSNANNNIFISNSVGAEMTVSSSVTLANNSAITNSGTMFWTSNFNTIGNRNVTIVNTSGAVFNSTNSSASMISAGNYINSGTMNFSGGTTFQGGAITNNLGANINFSAGQFQINVNGINNYGTFTVYDFYGNTGAINMYTNSLFNIPHAINTINNSFATPTNACATVDLSGAGSINYTSANNNLTTSTLVNFCGKVPVNGSHQTLTLTNASNSSPVTVTYSGSGFTPTNGMKVYIDGVLGNTAANGYWTLVNVNTGLKKFDLVGSVGNGNYSASTATIYNNPALGNANYIGYANCSNPCAPLSVKLAFFNALVNQDQVKLTWGAFNEDGNKVYVVEKSTDGESFDELSIVQPKTKSSDINSYGIYDSFQGSNRVWYRLKCVDYSGKVTYSNIVAVDFAIESNWVVYPNPSSDGSFSVQINSMDGNATLTLSDVAGNVIATEQMDEFHKTMSYSKLNRGIYLVTVSDATSSHSNRLVVN